MSGFCKKWEIGGVRIAEISFVSLQVRNYFPAWQFVFCRWVRKRIAVRRPECILHYNGQHVSDLR